MSIKLQISPADFVHLAEILNLNVYDAVCTDTV